MMQTVTLAEVCNLNPKHKLNDYADDLKVAFVGMPDVSEITRSIQNKNEKELKNVRKGFTHFLNDDVIVAKITPCYENGKMAVIDIPQNLGFGSTEFHVFRTDKKRLLPKCLFYFLSSSVVRARGAKSMTGSAGQKRVPMKFFSELKIPLLPLDTQKYIVAGLDAADQLRRKRKQAIALLDDYLKAVFMEMFGDPHHNIHNLPVGVIGDLVDEVKYGTSKKAEVGGEYPYLRMNNITYSGELNISDLKYINLTEGEKPKYLAQRGDVLFNRTNSKELVGKTAVYDLDEPMAIAGYLIRVRVNDKAIPEYIAGYLNSKHGKLTLESMCKNIVGMVNINAKELQKISINIPPLRLQKDYADVVSGIRALKVKMTSQSQELDVNFNALMQGAFEKTNL